MRFNGVYKFYGIVTTVIILTCGGCGSIKIGGGSFGYNLKGVTIPPECKTANVEYFKNQAPIVEPQLSQKLTEKLKDKLLSQTRLKLTNGTGDINFQGSIENFTTQPIAPQGGDVVTAAANRLSITIKVKYSNSKDSKWEYETSFTRFIDYNANKNPSDAQNSADYDTMLDQLVQDIFDRAFVNW